MAGAAILGVLFGALPGVENLPLSPLFSPVAGAERVRIEEIWQRIYQEMPDIPLENAYINKDSGDVSPQNTLLGRLIRYHIYTKGRSTVYRLDWKLTLADYLGVNERMDAATYPSGDSLRDHPMTADAIAVRGLTRRQRDALVEALVRSFNPNVQPEPEPAVVMPSPVATPSPPASRTRFPPQPQPGDAQLLQP